MTPPGTSLGQKRLKAGLGGRIEVRVQQHEAPLAVFQSCECRRKLSLPEIQPRRPRLAGCRRESCPNRAVGRKSFCRLPIARSRTLASSEHNSHQAEASLRRLAQSVETDSELQAGVQLCQPKPNQNKYKSSCVTMSGLHG